ncbi:MAG: hypothetical protein ACRD0F_04655, partial [Acidimicrobiales bacterium]
RRGEDCDAQRHLLAADPAVHYPDHDLLVRGDGEPPAFEAAAARLSGAPAAPDRVVEAAAGHLRFAQDWLRPRLYPG